MTKAEKRYIRRLIVRMYYFGELDEIVTRLCHMVGWASVVTGHIDDDQHQEIAELVREHYAEVLQN